jgi:hypothetical protein
MLEFIIMFLPWLLSVLTILSMHYAGKKKVLGWKIALLNSGLWLIWILATGTWGLLPMNLALWYVYGKNYYEWRKEARLCNSAEE